MVAFITDAGRSVRRSFREALEGNCVTIVRTEAKGDPLLDFARSTVSGLSASPRKLECSFLYNERGSALFDRITELPEYYLTRTESGILASSARLIREIAGPATLVELGSGSSAKTDHLLRAWAAQGCPVRYIPVDISEDALSGACNAISHDHPCVRIVGLNTDYRAAFPLFREVSPVMVLFLGSTIGNFDREEMPRFLGSLSEALSAGDFFLIGIDLVKDRSIIEAAYNDGAGVTAEFTRNLFARMNRELGSNIDLSAVEHVARYDAEKGQMEIFARFTTGQTIRVAPLGQSFAVAAGEEILVEISRKFRLEAFLPCLQEVGLETVEVFTDERRWFALVLARKMGAGG
jgi:L-histidine N-alpha-methyltransferase